MPMPKHLLVCWNLVLLFIEIAAQDANIVLSQGTLVGLKVFPETSRIPVYTYLGVPYAQPPTGDLRFAPPIPNLSWNRSLIAREFKSICPQIDGNIYEESADGFAYTGRKVDEDCLYLNIWTPETAFRYGSFPVLVIVTGEEYAFDWLNRPSGLDLASDGVVVVTVQYRMNIFGWLTLETEQAPGNLGLLDQQLAIMWIKDNIGKFGGDPSKLIILGHGTSGAATAMLQMFLPRSKNKLTKAILMGGSLLSPFSPGFGVKREHPSSKLIQVLACGGGNRRYILKCLRQKSVSDLLRAYETIYQNGNSSWILGPIVDNFLPIEKRCFLENFNLQDELKGLLEKPLMMGITSNEAAFIREQWVDLGKQGHKMLKTYIDETILPNVIEQFRFPAASRKQVKETISWRFFDQLPPDPPYLINAMQKILTETKYEIPFYQTIEMISSPRPNSTTLDNRPQEPNMSNFYVYVFQHSNSMDMRGRINFFGGASHSSELPFLFGPSLFQQIGRRRLSQTEDKLCKKFRSFLVEFVKTSNPTPGRLFDTWHPYTTEQKFIKLIGSRLDSINKLSSSESQSDSTFEDNLQKIEQMLIPVTEEIQIVTSAVNPYNLNPSRDQQETRSGKTAAYIEEAKNSEYFYYLKKVHAFWHDFLPKLAKMEQFLNDGSDKDGAQVGLSDQDTQKYKHAFFSMLTLVCLLLAILGVCVYILKRNNDSDLGGSRNFL